MVCCRWLYPADLRPGHDEALYCSHSSPTMRFWAVFTIRIWETIFKTIWAPNVVSSSSDLHELVKKVEKTLDSNTFWVLPISWGRIYCRGAEDKTWSPHLTLHPCNHFFPILNYSLQRWWAHLLSVFFSTPQVNNFYGNLFIGLCNWHIIPGISDHNFWELWVRKMAQRACLSIPLAHELMSSCIIVWCGS